MRRFLATLLFAALPSPLPAAPLDQGAECRSAVQRMDFTGALAPCRSAAREPDAGRDLLLAAARAEYEAGDPLAAASLHERVLADGWSEESAIGRADALWRAGKSSEAETGLREVLARGSSERAAQRLIELLMAFARPAEVPPIAREGLRLHPCACALAEWWGAAEASLGRDEGAARLFREAVRLGCPRFRWTTIGPVPGFLERPQLRALIPPAAVLEGIEALPEREALHRLKLLRVSLDAGAAEPLAALVERTRWTSVRLESVGLLGRLGASAASAWRRLLASPNVVARRAALRQIFSLGDPALAPALATYVKEEKVASLRGLGSLALARLRAAERRFAEAESLLRAIPEGDEVYPAALAELAAIADEQGREAEAAELRRRSRAASDRQRMLPTSAETAPGVPRS